MIGVIKCLFVLTVDAYSNAPSTLWKDMDLSMVHLKKETAAQNVVGLVPKHINVIAVVIL